MGCGGKISVAGDNFMPPNCGLVMGFLTGSLTISVTYKKGGAHCAPPYYD